MSRLNQTPSLVFILAAALLIVGCGGGPKASPEDIAAGQKLFRGTCATCHGPNGEGMPKLGKNLNANKFVAGLSDEEFVQFLKVGRSAGDPLNERGVDMPPKGGNPALSDQDLVLITNYVRSIQ